MKISDYSYYKKNSLSKYNLSNELSRHREIKREQETSKINDFVIPTFSAIITLLTWYYANSSGDLAVFLGVLLVIVIYPLLYFSIEYIFVPFLLGIYKWWMRNFNGLDFDEISQKEKIETFIDKFEYEISGQISLAYTLITNKEDVEEEAIKKYYTSESLFYCGEALSQLNKIFGDLSRIKILIFSQERTRKLKSYRIKENFNLLRNVLEEISLINTINDKGFKIDLTNYKLNYNSLCDRLIQLNIEVERI